MRLKKKIWSIVLVESSERFLLKISFFFLIFICFSRIVLWVYLLPAVGWPTWLQYRSWSECSSWILFQQIYPSYLVREQFQILYDSDDILPVRVEYSGSRGVREHLFSRGTFRALTRAKNKFGAPLKKPFLKKILIPFLIMFRLTIRSYTHFHITSISKQK